MPYKIGLFGSHDCLLDQVTVRKDKDIKRELHKAVDEWDFSDGDKIAIFYVTDIEIGTDDMFNGILEDLRKPK